MKRHSGFSITELLILIFAIVVVTAVLFPMKIIDIHQAERIALWKSFYPELEYSFDLMQQREKLFIEKYKEGCYIEADTFFNTFIKYCSVDYERTKNTDFSKYKHIFLNGKIIKKISKFHADRFIVLKNGMIVSFTGFERNIDKKDAPVGVLLIDIDGKNRRNAIGRDVFIVTMYIDRLEPMGQNSSVQEMKEDCSAVGSGLKCSAYYLVGGSF